MKDCKKNIGDYGEKIAREYYQRNGYKIITSNWFCSGGEVDLIARKNEVYVFVEVKLRSRFSGEVDAVAGAVFNLAKQKRFVRAMTNYLSVNDIKNPFQVDLLLIIKDCQNLRIYQYENYELYAVLAASLY